MDKIARVRQEIRQLRREVDDHNYYLDNSGQAVGYGLALDDIEKFLDTLSEEPEDESDLQDAEVIFSGHALHTDVTKWADGYKLKIRIYDDN